MRRLVYTSTAKSLMDERHLQSLLWVSRRNNRMNEITGLLVYHDGCFFQVLEGETDRVEACFSRICRDSRHENFILLSRDHIASRIFSQWWMAYHQFEELDPHQKKQLLSLRDFAAQARDHDLTRDPKTNALLLAFLSGFRDLDMVG